MRDTERLVVVTSDFLAGGGDDMLAGLDLPAGAIQLEEGPTIRDAMAQVLRDRGGRLPADDPRRFDPNAPRIAMPARRPIRCR